MSVIEHLQHDLLHDRPAEPHLREALLIVLSYYMGEDAAWDWYRSVAR